MCIRDRPSIVNILTYLINFSFERGEFPESLKVAIVLQVYKYGDSKEDAVKDDAGVQKIFILNIF